MRSETERRAIERVSSKSESCNNALRRRIPFSEMSSAGRLDVTDVVQPIYDEINKQYGLKEAPKHAISPASSKD
jgi:translation initiation factor 2 beta subunit (eIF-2beta)/eIF-5